jgi:hypothetical protein
MIPGLELRQWREGKVRPIPGNSPHDRLVSRVISSSFKESLRRSLPRHCFPQLQTILGAQYAFSRYGGIYLVRCGFKIKIKTKNQTLGWDRVASRWSAPSPGSRTCREDHAPSHRPQMSSGRLFLDRVARQHCRRVGPGNFTPSLSQIPDVNLSAYPARATH